MDRVILQHHSEDIGGGLRLCESLGVAFQDDMTRSVEYGADYFEKYVSYRRDGRYGDVESVRADLAERVGLPIVDIGIGCGAFLEECQSRELLVLGGCDVNPKAIAWLRERELFIESLANRTPLAIALTLWDVLEHIRNPHELLDQTRTGDALIVSLPIFDDLRREVLTSKHHDGFCLWPSAHTEHDVASSSWRAGQGDVLAELAAACRAEGLDTRLVHPLTSQQFRQPANPGDKTDDHDLAAIFRAAINGFGLVEPVWPDEYQQLQLLVRQRRDLVDKASVLRNQVREQLHALLPGYAECFGDLWEHQLALPLARVVTSSDALRDRDQVLNLLKQHQLKARGNVVATIVAWALQAPAPPAHVALRHAQWLALDDDRLAKIALISSIEVQLARLLCRTPFVLLMVIPGISVVNAADLAGEVGPLHLYPSANAITGRAGLMPSRYQSDLVDRPNGPLRRHGNRRLRRTLLQVADSLVSCNHHFGVQTLAWRQRGKDPRWIRVKVAKAFSRLLFAIVGGILFFLIFTFMLGMGFLGGALMGLLGVVVGYIAPEFWLGRKVKARQKAILLMIPDTLDLLTISVRAGLGFDAALGRVVDKLKGPLSDEFRRALAEVRVGKARTFPVKLSLSTSNHSGTPRRCASSTDSWMRATLRLASFTCTASPGPTR